jgi:N-carbamoyl-L-amino-acid hydrolase
VSASFDALWAELQPIGRDPRTGGYHRPAWGRVDAELREWFAGACSARGLDVTTDRAGNLWAWWDDPDAAVSAGRPGLVIGSHLDSVPDGGAFDGPLGIVSALAALDTVREQGWRPGRPLGIAVLADEEGARFGTGCVGSQLLTGNLDPARMLAATDDDGTTLAEAMAAAGHDPRRVGPDPTALARVGTFLELHVEQGRRLVHTGAAVGVGSGLWARGRWRLHLPGRADHAGTTRLDDRDDPVLRLATTVLAARTAAERAGAVATVGKIVVEPNGANAIPSAVTAWLDARAGRLDDLHEVVADVAAAAGVAPEQEALSPVTVFSQGLRETLVGVVGEGVPAPVLATAAGHDAGTFAAAGIASGMLFVRNPTGISHSPAEYADVHDCHAGVAALGRAIRALDGWEVGTE